MLKLLILLGFALSFIAGMQIKQRSMNKLLKDVLSSDPILALQFATALTKLHGKYMRNKGQF